MDMPGYSPVVDGQIPLQGSRNDSFEGDDDGRKSRVIHCSHHLKVPRRAMAYDKTV